MPIDYSKYPVNWKETRERILKRANNCCEHCGVKNYSTGTRDKDGSFHIVEGMALEASDIDGDKIIQIVLTIAHLDHDETNWNVKDERLAALCQKCHLVYDIPEKKKRRHKKKAIGDLFPNS